MEKVTDLHPRHLTFPSGLSATGDLGGPIIDPLCPCEDSRMCKGIKIPKGRALLFRILKPMVFTVRILVCRGLTVVNRLIWSYICTALMSTRPYEVPVTNQPR